MKFSILVVFFLLIVLNSASDAKTKGFHRLVGKKYRRNATELKAYHQQRAKLHKNYVPEYPEDPMIANVLIGDSEDEFIVSLESGTNNFWLLDISYPHVGPNVTTFDPSSPNSSATFEGPFYSESNDFALYGKSVNDTFALFEPMILTFGSVEMIYGDRFDPAFNADVSGALGLSWDIALKDEPVTPHSAPILNIFNAMADKPPRIISQTIEQDPSSGQWTWFTTTFGANLDEFCAPTPLTVAPLTFDEKSNSLSFQLDSFAIGDRKTNDGDLAKIDSGLSVIFVNSFAFDLIYAAIQPDFDYDVGVYTTSCQNKGTFDDFVFTVNDVEMHVPSSSYVIDLGLGNDQCVVAFSYTSSFSTPFALGTVFLENYGVELSIDDSTITFKLCS
ncbi:Peptidase A1 domain-containing protein [Aphelenchoides besseyi]|nr:Peptidase A1 domain-containing protein [Aphelenchoides besseyi]